MSGSGSACRPLRIGIDATAVRRPPTGADNYILRLVEHVGPAAPHHRFTVFANLQDVKPLRRRVATNVRVVPTALRWRPTRTVSHQVLIPAWTRWGDLDVLHSTAFILSFATRRPQVLTVHDMTFYSLPESLRPPVDRAFRRLVRSGLHRADRILVPSEATRRVIASMEPGLPEDRVEVIHYGVDERFAPAPAEAIRDLRGRLGIERDYFLYLGTLEPRKNLPALVRAYARAVAEGCDADLVLAGRWGWNREPLERELEALPPSCRVHLPGFVTDAEARTLYSGARVFVYPSIEEGFGFPPLEAMACGTPVVSSDRSSTAEVLGAAAELVDPDDEDALAEAVARLWNDPDRREELRRRGFERVARYRWRETAVRTVAAYERVAGSDPEPGA